MNVADRIYAVARHVASTSGEQSLQQAWIDYLQSVAPGVVSTGFEHRHIYEANLAFLDEVADLRKRLTVLGAPVELYESMVTLAGEVFQPVNMRTELKRLHPNFTEHFWLTLRWASWTLKDDGTAIEPALLQKLRDQLAGLEASEKEPSLPAGLRSALRRQIESLKNALMLYEVKGKAAVAESFKTSLTEVLAVDVPAEADVSPETLSTMQKMKENVLTSGLAVGKAAVVVKEGVEVIQLLGQGYNWFAIATGLPQLPL